MRVAIAEYGAEGKLSYEYYVAKGHEVTIVTNRVSPDFPIPTGAKADVRPDAFDNFLDYDLIIRSPPRRPDSIKTHGKVWSATNEFFAQCPAPIIGVTGTKGKGTTASLVASVLRAAGRATHLVGNIGVPALSVLPDIREDDIVVYELSSFQLWDLEKSPHIAVVLMIEADHLDVHRDMEEYLEAKSQIVAHQNQNDTTLYHPTNELSARIAHEGEGQKRRYAIPDDQQVYIKSNTFFIQETPICSLEALQIVGEFNQQNACAAISAALRMGVDRQFVEQGLKDFSGLPHRLQLVGNIDGVRFFDDSIATTPGSAIAALETFREQKVIILGGSDKGASYQSLVDTCQRTGATVVAIGQTGEKIAALCRASNVPVIREPGTMAQVVRAARAAAKPGDVVILSPASASFDQYKSYSDRGEQFARAIKELSA